MNTDAAWPTPQEAEARVLHMQRKLHEWASRDAERRFCDLWNLVYDRATLMVAWDRVRGNRGSRTAGIDAVTRSQVEQRLGVDVFLQALHDELKERCFRPLPVREHQIPKRGGSMRRLGIPTLRDRVVQMALKLILEPIFESEFYPSSYGYRPGRRAQDAIAEIVHFTKAPSHYEWVIEADIEACFDRIDHGQVMGELRRRIGDKHILRMVRLFLRADVMRETGQMEPVLTGTPQGGVLSPLLANIALSALDRYYQHAWEDMSRYPGKRQYLRTMGHPTYRLVRFADDFVILVKGTREQAEVLLGELTDHVVAMGLSLKVTKTRVIHIDEGFQFLGQRIVRRSKGPKHFVYTLVSDDALAAIKRRIKALTGRSTTYLELVELLRALNPILRGWAAYFRYGAVKRTFAYLGYYTWWRVMRWLRKKHPRLRWKQARRRYFGPNGLQDKGVVLYNPATMRVLRYRFRGGHIPTPWNDEPRFPRMHDDPAFLDRLDEALT